MNEMKNTIEEIKKQMDAIQSDFANNSGMITSITEVFNNAVNQAEEDLRAFKDHVIKYEGDEKLLAINLVDTKKAIEELSQSLSEKNQAIVDQEKMTTELKEITSNLISDHEAMINQNQVDEGKLAGLKTDHQEKTTAKNNLLATIDTKVKSNHEELEAAKSSYIAMLEDYGIWEFIFSKLEAPEIEILAIIAINRGISTEEIKAKAENVQAVFVTRSVSKLEADGKIIQNENGTWDLSMELISKIKD